MTPPVAAQPPATRKHVTQQSGTHPVVGLFGWPRYLITDLQLLDTLLDIHITLQHLRRSCQPIRHVILGAWYMGEQHFH